MYSHISKHSVFKDWIFTWKWSHSTQFFDSPRFSQTNLPHIHNRHILTCESQTQQLPYYHNLKKWKYKIICEKVIVKNLILKQFSKDTIQWLQRNSGQTLGILWLRKHFFLKQNWKSKKNIHLFHQKHQNKL